ncbi:MAG: hypothetical protein WAN76_17025 [Candidatus Sulfotelmatobacter sp.]
MVKKKMHDFQKILREHPFSKLLYITRKPSADAIHSKNRLVLKGVTCGKPVIPVTRTLPADLREVDSLAGQQSKKINALYSKNRTSVTVRQRAFSHFHLYTSL